MRGRRKDTYSIHQQGHKALNDMYKAGKGTSKHQDKHSGRGFDGKIYSSGTLTDYKRKWSYFCKDLKENGHRPKSMQDAIAYMPQYAQRLQARGLSAWTVRNYVSAAAKALGVSAAETCKLPDRHRADITRSRGTAKRDSHFSVTRNRDLITFVSCTGLRNRKELQQIRGTDLIQRADGTFCLSVKGKGGKYRKSVIYGTDKEIAAVVDRCRTAGTSLVWPVVHAGADIHSYRAQYASRMYTALARDPATLPASERYCCRGDLSGTWYDKAALMAVSVELGHARCNVVVTHYLWPLRK